MHQWSVWFSEFAEFIEFPFYFGKIPLCKHTTFRVIIRKWFLNLRIILSNYVVILNVNEAAGMWLSYIGSIGALILITAYLMALSLKTQFFINFL